MAPALITSKPNVDDVDEDDEYDELRVEGVEDFRVVVVDRVAVLLVFVFTNNT